MKIAIAAGGTGGHFYPGLAVAKELIAAGDEVFFFVRKADYVIPLLQREDLSYREIEAAGLTRGFRLQHLLLPAKLLAGFAQSLKSMTGLRPDALLAMGGYLSAPPVLAARLLGIPVVLHEQNVRPGLANRWLAHLAHKVAISFSESQRYFGSSSVVTGNPVRQEILSPPAKPDAREALKLDPSLKTFLIFGGSLGAHRLNEWLVKAFTALQGRARSFQVFHLTGVADESWVREAYAATKVCALTAAYCHSMEAAYAAADFVVCRAGASTVSELMVLRKPALLIPYPLAAGGHQLANAAILAEVGAATVMQERSLGLEELVKFLGALIDDDVLLPKMEANYERLRAAPPFHAAGRIVQLLGEVVK